MKNSIYLFLFLFSSCFQVLGQQLNWQVILYDINDIKLLDIKEGTNKDIFIAAFGKKTNRSKEFSLIYKFDSTGIIQDSIMLTSVEKSIRLSSINILNNGFLSVFGASFDSISGTNVSFFNSIYNLNLEHIWTKTHSINPEIRLDEHFTKIQQDNSILLFGSCIVDPSRFTSMIFKFDSSFTLIKWNLPDKDNYGIYVDVKQLSDSSFWALKLFPWRYEKLDTNFLLIDYYPIPGLMTGNMSMKWVNDSTFFLLGKNLYPLPAHNLSIIKQFHPFDTTGHLYWRWHHTDTIDFPSIYKGIDFKHPDTIFAGGTHNLDLYNPYYSNQISWLVVLQTDSMLNLRWERFYGGDAYYVMSNLLATHDGGCIVGGWRFDNKNSTENQMDIILLKLNSEGLLTGINNPSVMQLYEAIVYPNPGSRQLKVRLAVQHPQALFQLFDQGGRLVMQQQLTATESELETSHLATGIYVYRITSSTGLNENGKWVKQ